MRVPKRTLWRFFLPVLLIVLVGTGAVSIALANQDVPPQLLSYQSLTPLADALGLKSQQVLNKPANIVCRPYENTTTGVIVTWEDKSDDETDYRVERRVGGGNWSQVATLPANSTKYQETGLSPSTVYRYRVRAYRAGDNTFGPYSDVCRKPSAYDTTNFRVYYRTQDCPAYNGRQMCVPNTTNPNGDNETAARIGSILEGSRKAFMDVGFDDLAFYNNAKRLPADLRWCDGGGCAGTSGFGNGRKGGIGLAPQYMGPYNPGAGQNNPSSVLITLHEAFHQQQYTYGGIQTDPDGNWVWEGQARSIQDKFCVGTSPATCISLDNVTNGLANYMGEVNGYLANPNRSIPHLSYGTALFWTYVTEQYGTLNQEPNRGVDLLVRFWEQARNDWNDDGIGTLNRALQTMGYTQRFRDIFKDFVVANYAKDVPNAPAKYKYIDESQAAGPYHPVHLDVDEVLGPDDQVGPATSDVVAWGARYFQVRPTADVPILNIEFRQETANDVYYTLLAIKGDNIAKEINHTGRDFVQTLLNDNYDKVVVIVAGLDHYANFRYAFNATRPILNIVDPIQGRAAEAGDPAAPEKILIKVEVLSPLAGGAPIAGINTNAFTITIGTQVVQPSQRISSAYIQGQYWMLIRAPTQTTSGYYDLTVSYTATMSDTEQDAVHYAPRSDADNVVIIDRSGSMAGNKLVAAKDAARLYVDSWRAGDKIGVVSYNEDATVDLTLRDWNNASRNAAFTAINGLAAGGMTSIGDGLLSGLDELIARGNNAHTWALIVLSDGIENRPKFIKDFMDAYKARRNAGKPVPRVHTVALGADADRARLQKLAQDTGGTYHYASEPPTPLRTARPDEVAAYQAYIAQNLPLDLSEIYRVIGETVAHQQQIFSAKGNLDPFKPISRSILVDEGASEGIFVVKWAPWNVSGPDTKLLRPDGTDMGPPTAEYKGHKVWRVPTPMGGEWQVILGECTDPQHEFCGQTYLVEVALKSDLTMDLFLGLPVDERMVGKPMPILVSLSDNRPLPRAAVNAEITDPSGQTWSLPLFDDGMHGDGAEDDGFYGNTFYQTFMEGGYVVVVTAEGRSRRLGRFQRRLRASFDMAAAEDRDDDRMPDWWEEKYGTNPEGYDPDADPDNDGLPNIEEFRRGTHPLDPDTDDGGEGDGSEVRRGTDPLDPRDDRMRTPRVKAWPGVDRNWVRFTVDPFYMFMRIYRAQGREGEFQLIAPEVAPTGEWEDYRVKEGVEYCYRVVAVGKGEEESGASETTCATPKADPIPPVGGVLINQGAPSTTSLDVRLSLWASDEIMEPESDHPGAPPRPEGAAVSGVRDMMIANNARFENAVWEPYRTSRDWELQPDPNGLATVYVKYRDDAGNESDVYHASIRYVEAPPTPPPGPLVSPLKIPYILKGSSMNP